MKEVRINYENLELIKNLTVYAENDGSFYKQIAHYLVNAAYDKNADIEEIDLIRKNLKEIANVLFK